MERAELSEYSEDEVVSRYLSSPWPEDDDPIDDCMRVIRMAAVAGESAGHSNVETILGEHSIHTAMNNMQCPTLQSLIERSSVLCAAFYPNINEKAWAGIILKILAGRYGGTEVYIKKKKKLTPEMVRRLTPGEIMARYGVSRSYAYRLLSKK